MIQIVAISVTIFTFTVSLLAFLLGWDRKDFLEFLRLVVFQGKPESIFESLKLRLGLRFTRYLDDEINLPDNTYGIESIRLTSGIEIKEYDVREFEIRPFTRVLLFAGWGVIKGEKRYVGSLMEQGDIGQVEFIDKNKKKISRIMIALPATEYSNFLRIADMRPSISGDPTQDIVKAMGLITRAKLRYRPSPTMIDEEFANVWVSDIQVPDKARYVRFNTKRGSIHIANLIAIRSLRKRRWTAIREKQPKLEDILSKHESMICKSLA